MVDPSAATLREATLADCEPVLGLVQQFGLSEGKSLEDARTGWEGLWLRNPVQRLDRPMPPLGWLLEVEDRLVGFFGSVPLRYQLGDRTLVAGVGTSWAVEKPYRKRTRDLVQAYFEQPGVDLLLGTSGIPASGKIYLRNGGAALPVPSYDRVMLFVITAAPFARAVLRQKGVNPSWADAAGTALAPGVAAAVAIGRRRPGRPQAGLEPEAIRLDQIGDEFDDLWQRKLAEAPRFYAWRTAEDLRWHFAERGRARSVTMLRCRRGGRLAGYLAWEREDVERLGLVRARIADLFVEHDEAEVVDALLAASWETARDEGCHILEWQGFPAALRARAERCRPFSRTLSPISFCFAARSAELAAALGREETWYPSLYDGDGSLG
ncbi:MAG: hypothetical protein OEP95_10505 [Myxococcales bacterium]|nr:hypothetical protein [Myxococcales bacterium]